MLVFGRRLYQQRYKGMPARSQRQARDSKFVMGSSRHDFQWSLIPVPGFTLCSSWFISILVDRFAIVQPTIALQYGERLHTYIYLTESRSVFGILKAVSGPGFKFSSVYQLVNDSSSYSSPLCHAVLGKCFRIYSGCILTLQLISDLSWLLLPNYLHRVYADLCVQ